MIIKVNRTFHCSFKLNNFISSDFDYLFVCMCVWARASAGVCTSFLVNINLTFRHRRPSADNFDRDRRRQRRRCRQRRTFNSIFVVVVVLMIYSLSFCTLILLSIGNIISRISRDFRKKNEHKKKYLKYFSLISSQSYSAKYTRIKHTTYDWLTVMIVIGSCVCVCVSVRFHRRHVYTDQLNCLETDSEVECDYGAHNFHIIFFFTTRSFTLPLVLFMAFMANNIYSLLPKTQTILCWYVVCFTVDCHSQNLPTIKLNG